MEQISEVVRIATELELKHDPEYIGLFRLLFGQEKFKELKRQKIIGLDAMVNILRLVYKYKGHINMGTSKKQMRKFREYLLSIYFVKTKRIPKLMLDGKPVYPVTYQEPKWQLESPEEEVELSEVAGAEMQAPETAIGFYKRRGELELEYLLYQGAQPLQAVEILKERVREHMDAVKLHHSLIEAAKHMD